MNRCKTYTGYKFPAETFDSPPATQKAFLDKNPNAKINEVQQALDEMSLGLTVIHIALGLVVTIFACILCCVPFNGCAKVTMVIVVSLYCLFVTVSSGMYLSILNGEEAAKCNGKYFDEWTEGDSVKLEKYRIKSYGAPFATAQLAIMIIYLIGACLIAGLCKSEEAEDEQNVGESSMQEINKVE